MFIKRIDDCNCDRPRGTLIVFYKKKVNTRSTKHQVHFGINRAISILIRTLIDIIFVIFKNDKGILDYNKGSQDIKCSVFLPHGTFD